MTRSKTFEITLNTNTGLKFPTSVLEFFLWRGTTLAILRSAGISPWWIVKLIMWVKGAFIWWMPSLRNLAGIESRPVAFPCPILRTILQTHSSSTTEKENILFYTFGSIELASQSFQIVKSIWFRWQIHYQFGGNRGKIPIEVVGHSIIVKTDLISNLQTNSVCFLFDLVPRVLRLSHNFFGVPLVSSVLSLKSYCLAFFTINWTLSVRKQSCNFVDLWIFYTYRVTDPVQNIVQNLLKHPGFSPLFQSHLLNWDSLI